MVEEKIKKLDDKTDDGEIVNDDNDEVIDVKSIGIEDHNDDKDITDNINDGR